MGKLRFKGQHHTIEAKKKISKASKKRWQNKEYKKRVSNKISEGKKGKSLTESHKQALKNNHKGFTGKHQSKKNRKRISEKLMGHAGAKNQPKIVRHHTYLVENSIFNDIMLLTPAKHNSLHKQAYRYIMEIYGKIEIDKYIRWFDRKFGLK
jgi:hypothetical protein